MIDPDAEHFTAVAEAIADALKRTGSISHAYHNGDERDLLRQAGRRVGRMLNRPVRTVDAGRSVHVVLTDWGNNPLETQLSELRANKAIDAALATDDDSGHSGPRPRR
jgi:hypothetical protein